ncbi:protein kinase (VPS15), putative [Talaromyces stipitatus ATCC 10500]|uniref:non-specific serine/threonine protein kinase n=1 Tax=Talaromyces stipitatus (strain ATCC 10500 / CBS 375.48 / QM 6759 / NRRL 1006) TaxID=441959 RepID=B8MES7_TALSN|nr:protein kinase (VPS15), putative [Talaromyces stipitatus ATCC 10500]EED16960.1 protein kinase (VPS15), putative [Talaromyces stipitatus ATCC 10500]
MGQGYSLTTLSAGSAGIDVPELSDMVYEKSLGSARFMKSIRARQRNGLAFVKVIMKPYPSMQLDPYVKAIARERELLASVPNALAYQRIIETGTSGYLVRQYIHSSLYDRLSTRPFLEDIEKRWIAFQLLCALRDCHTQEVFHGDIKTENVLVTSWNWLYLSDFSSSFKPTFLPEDNPADFSFYFDTSGRRTCYLAPERFLEAGEEPGDRKVNWAMDIFSVGCVIAELFLEAPIFTLSQLYKYRKGEYSPEHSQLSKIEDSNVKDLILHMIQIDPESRYSAEEYLNFWRHKVFPDYFYSFLHQYMSLITEPASGRTHVDAEAGNFGESDDRIDRLYLDFDKISYFLGSPPVQAKDGSKLMSANLIYQALPVQLDLPNSQHETSNMNPQEGALIFLTVVVSNLRNTSKASAKVKACDLLLAFAERLPDESKLDRILPYVMTLLNDRSDVVKVAAIRTLSQLLSIVQVVSPVNAYIFPEYIFPRLQPFVAESSFNPSPMVRAAYASCISSLAQSSLRFLDMIQALRTDTRLRSVIPAGSEANWTEEATFHNLYDVARADLLEYFEVHTKALLTDSDSSVRRAFLGSVSSLCVFFGSTKINDVILSHLNTYLNDKDWILKCAFFEAVVGVATHIGSTSLEEFILPLMVPSLTDTEDFVVERVIRSMAAMADLGLFQRSTTWELLNIVVRFFAHPSIWIRESSVYFVITCSKYLSFADKHSILTPLIRPFLKTNIITVTEGEILDALKRPLSKSIYDMAIIWAQKSEKGNFWKAANRESTFSLTGSDAIIGRGFPRNVSLAAISKNEEDAHWISRLKNLGMTPEDEFKVLVLREYIWRVAMKSRKTSDATEPSLLNDILSLSQYGITPQTVFFDKNQDVRQRKVSTDNVYSPTNEEPRSHTIADALLDASTNVDTQSAARRKHQRSATQPPKDSNPARRSLAIAEGIRADSDGPSTSSSPTTQPISQDSSAQNSDIERVTTKTSLDADRASDRSSVVTETGSLSQINSQTRIERKSSAINLLNRKETTKAYAETSMNSMNAFGKVDVHSQQKKSSGSPLAIARESNTGQQATLQRYRAGHSYKGRDPRILRLLDDVFAENYPTDFFDLGPYVKEIDSRRPIRRASGEESDKPWRPEGVLVALFGEHTGPINRVVVAPDHGFFVTASDDSTVKVWDTTRLEKNLTPRSRQTHRHAPGTKVKCLTFVENTYTFVSAATDGSIHAVKVDYQNINETVRYGKLQIVRQYQLPEGDDGSIEYATWIEHYRSEGQSVLLIATNTCRILALDMKTMLPLYTVQNPVHHGTPRVFCFDRKHSWLIIGTSHGILDLWDLRFRVRLKAWGLPGGTAIHRLQIHPTKGRGRWVCVAGGSVHGSEITVWDVEKVQCREVYRAASASTMGSNPSTPSTPNSHRTSVVNNLAAMHTVTKSYEAWRVDEDRPEGMLSRFANPSAAGIEPNINPASPNSSSLGDPNGICALHVGYDMPADGKESTKCGFAITAGSDRKVRFWDLVRPELSSIVSGLDISVVEAGAAAKPRYETVQPTTSLTVTTEFSPSLATVTGGGSGGRSGSSSGKKGHSASASRPPRSTVISLQQQQLLKSHLDSILDVAVLRAPYGMTVSVDRAGMVYVFQ